MSWSAKSNQHNKIFYDNMDFVVTLSKSIQTARDKNYPIFIPLIIIQSLKGILFTSKQLI